MRSKWKGAYVAPTLFNINENSQKMSKNIEIVGPRNSTILPEYVNLQIKIHNGKDFKKIEIKNEHIGLKFGELAVTKKSAKYKSPAVRDTRNKKK